MIEIGLIAFTTLFATVGPQDVAALFAALTSRNTAAERRAIALKSTLIAAGILFFFAFFGDTLLGLFGITLPALRTAGGVLLLLIAIDLVFARVREQPRRFPVVHREVRRGLLRRFPYGIYFVIDGDVAVVIAVLHMHRDPDVWRRRDQRSS